MSGDGCLPQHHGQDTPAPPTPLMACPKTKTCSSQGAMGLGNKYVHLNVGGMLFDTTLQVLTKQNSMLKDMFSGKREVFTDKDGWILIDRSGKHFGSILCFLRDGTVFLPKGRQAVQELMAEAKFYLIQDLVELCQNALLVKAVQKSVSALTTRELFIDEKEKNEQPLCVIPVITSCKEEELLIQTSSKPVVKLVYNRSNNKYSYTSNSDDNLLKNIELFDRLTLSFNSRVLFIKDVIGDEICCWSFYGQGRKLTEVCCTSIVYATEKKQTKVEFPEARIYEETLNTMLYEKMPLPDNSLLEITQRSYTNSGYHSEEEEDGTRGSELRERVRRIHVKRYSTYDDRPLGH